MKIGEPPQNLSIEQNEMAVELFSDWILYEIKLEFSKFESSNDENNDENNEKNQTSEESTSTEGTLNTIERENKRCECSHITTGKMPWKQFRL